MTTTLFTPSCGNSWPAVPSAPASSAPPVGHPPSHAPLVPAVPSPAPRPPGSAPLGARTPIGCWPSAGSGDSTSGLRLLHAPGEWGKEFMKVDRKTKYGEEAKLQYVIDDVAETA